MAVGKVQAQEVFVLPDLGKKFFEEPRCGRVVKFDPYYGPQDEVALFPNFTGGFPGGEKAGRQNQGSQHQDYHDDQNDRFNFHGRNLPENGGKGKGGAAASRAPAGSVSSGVRTSGPG